MRRRERLRPNAGVADPNALAAALLAGALQATGGATLGGVGAGVGVRATRGGGCGACRVCYNLFLRRIKVLGRITRMSQQALALVLTAWLNTLTQVGVP